MVLPENIDASYPDRDPGDAAHQQHHDELHAKVNALPALVQDAATLDADAAALIEDPASATTAALSASYASVTSLNDHLNDTADAHDASAISVTPTGGIAATDVQAALAELDGEKAGTGHVHAAASVTYAGSTNLSATNVEAALDELDTEKSATGHTHGFLGARTRRTTAQSVSHATSTAVTFNEADDYDTSSIHDPATNPSRFTVPAGMGGVWRFTSGAEWASHASSTARSLFWYKNGAVLPTSQGAFRFNSSAGVASFLATTVDLLLVAGDYIEVGVQQYSGAALDLTGASVSTQFLGSP